MNRTIISIEVQDHGGKEVDIIVKGERNDMIMFEEQFGYKDEETHSLKLKGVVNLISILSLLKAIFDIFIG